MNYFFPLLLSPGKGGGGEDTSGLASILFPFVAQAALKLDVSISAPWFWNSRQACLGPSYRDLETIYPSGKDEAVE